MIQIVTDSTADIPPDQARSAGLVIVPAHVRSGQEDYRDGVDLTADEFYARLRSRAELPATSGPPPGAYVEVYERALARGQTVLSLHLSGKLSMTYSSAALAASQFDGERMVAIDSLSGSMGLGLLALRAAAEARAGASLAQLRESTLSLLPRTHVYIALDTVKNLRRSGRVSRATALLTSVLDIKPISGLREGALVPRERVRTMGRTLDRLAELPREHRAVGQVAVGYTDVREVAVALGERIQATLPGTEVLIYQGGPAIGVHIGHGAVCVAFIDASAPP